MGVFNLSRSTVIRPTMCGGEFSKQTNMSSKLYLDKGAGVPLVGKVGKDEMSRYGCSPSHLSNEWQEVKEPRI